MPSGPASASSIFAAPLGLASVIEAFGIIVDADHASDDPAAALSRLRSLGVQRGVQAVLDSAPQMYLQLAALA
eukprot:3569622-Prymnesium_polylepis.1